MFAASKTASVSGDYQISRSLRFNDADTAYLTRTPASASNRKTWTWSAWIKRGKIDRYERYTLFASRPTANPYTLFYFSGGAQPNQYGLRFEDPSADLQTTQVFRDMSAWYHIVLAVDTTQATASNRIKMYVNGSQITVFTTATYPTQNTDMSINNTTEQCIGSNTYLASTEDFDGYMTEINLIDGTQLTPSSFGETNAQTGVWQPKAYSGSYGTNGFYLNFSDNSNTTAATLGKDYSGNGNNWTPNNFSVTAGVDNDSMVDVPTPYGVDTGAGGTVRGNYCTLNPLFIPKSGGVIAAISNGNLDAATNNSKVAFGTMQIPSTGKWYFEFTCNTFQYPSYGIGTSSALGGGYADAMFGFYQQGSNLQFNIGNNSATGTSSGIVSQAGDIALVCVDMDNGKIWMGRDRSGTVTWSGGGTPAVSSPTWSAAGQGGVWSTNFDTTSGWFPLVSSGGTDTWSCNFGQRPFAYTAPSGFKALCTQNLPTPTIGATSATLAGKFFNAVTYTGNGATQSINVGFQPDWVWYKSRSSAVYNHGLFDSVRGATAFLVSNSTQAETTVSGVTAFNSGGFTVGSDAGGNESSGSMVAWNWRASNATAVTNTAGSITSTVSANTTSGFSVVTWTAGSGAGTVGHGLGATPKMIITKIRSTVDDWYVYHQDIGNTKTLFLDTTNGQLTTTVWNNTSPTSSVFTYFGSNTQTYVAYCFAAVAGYSAFGSYTGNGSTDGTFVYLGFRPAYIMIKSTDANGWIVMDSKRNTYNIVNTILQPNTSGADSTDSTNYAVDFLSNGFKLRNSASYFNGSGVTLIYAAFAENPFKFSLAR